MNEEVLFLLRDNNRMLREIIQYINIVNANADSENMQDFFRNIIANLISTSFENGLLTKEIETNGKDKAN